MRKEIIVVGSLDCPGWFNHEKRVFHVGGVSPTLTSSNTQQGVKIVVKENANNSIRHRNTSKG